MRVLFFGTYDTRPHPRVRVLQEGLRALGDEVLECNAPLGMGTTWRVRMLQHPWLAPALAVRLGTAWSKLWWRMRRIPPVDAIVVGYLGLADVHLARILRRDSTIALDHLAPAAGTALDRGARALPARLLARADRAAVERADVVIVDTPEHQDLLPRGRQEAAVVAPVGAPAAWFRQPRRSTDGIARIVFFGLYTPLQGAPTVGAALRRVLADDLNVAITMIGHGQDLARARQAVGPDPRVRWVRWVAADDLPAVVAGHDICLGIFGTSPKARRVVPNKVYQGAAAGCAVVTSDTPPQRRALAGTGVHVPVGDPDALAAALADLARDPDRLWRSRVAAYDHANRAFRPEQVARPLHERLGAPVREQAAG